MENHFPKNCWASLKQQVPVDPIWVDTVTTWYKSIVVCSQIYPSHEDSPVFKRS